MLQLEETRITQLLKETIKVICRSADSCSEIAIKGLLGITFDRKEIFLVQIDDVIDMALERTGTPFQANGSNSSSALRSSSQSLFNQGTEQLQTRHQLNLSAGSADGKTVNNSAIPEHHTAKQTSNNSSVADTVSRSLKQAQGQRGENANTEDNSSLLHCSDVQGQQDCSTASVLVPRIALPQMITTRTSFSCISSRGRGRGRGQLGRGRGQRGRGRGQRGRGRGKRLAESGYRNEDVSLTVSGGLSDVPLPDDVKMRTRRSIISETHRTVISSFQDTVNNYSQRLESLTGGNGSVDTKRSAEHKTLKTLKQPAFKRKLKPFRVTTSKKSKLANYVADTGVLIIHPQVSSSNQSLNRCSACKRGFSKLTDLAEHYTKEHSSNIPSGHSASPAVQDETPEPIRCASPSCDRTFTTQRGMVQHCGRSHRRDGRFRLMDTRGGIARRGSRFGTHGSVDEKHVVRSVVGQIVPSVSLETGLYTGLYANVHTHSLPHTITEEEFGNAERDNGAPLSSSMIVKQEIDAVVYTDHTE